MAVTVRFLLDADIPKALATALRRKAPAVEVRRVQEVGLRTSADEAILEFAAQEGRIVVSRCAVAGKVPAELKNKLGIAIAQRTYKAARSLMSSPRWQRVYNAGARPQRLLWASTGTKDPQASDVLYIKAFAAPFTVNTMPENTLKALAAYTEIGDIMVVDGGDCEEVLAQFAKAGIGIDALAAQLQDEGAKSFVKSWNDLMSVIASKSNTIKPNARE